MLDYYNPVQLPIMLLSIATLGLFSFFMRRKSPKSSWPTWLFVPLAVFVSFPLGTESKPPDPLHPFYLVVIALISIRWAVAVALRERDKGWIGYLIMLFAIPCIVLPSLDAVVHGFSR